MYCPLHEDVNKRSASLNVLSGEWYCFAGCGGGNIIELIRARSRWIPRNASSNGSGSYHVPESSEPEEAVNNAMVRGWHMALMDDDIIMDYLISERGIHTQTLARFEIGWDREKQVYTIPVRGFDDELWNVRRYTPRPRGKTKIWSVRGMRVCELYPVSQIDADRIIICEGEWDTLLTIQHGYAAITRTAGASTWRHEWNEHFKDKLVYVCQDKDKEGQTANRRIARALHRIADVRIVDLPFDYQEKHGPDLTDFWLQYDNSDFEDLLSEAKPLKSKDEPSESNAITVLDSFDSQRVAEPVKLHVTIKGKKEPGYSLPRKVKLSCTRDRGPICQMCPLNAKGGDADYEIPPTSPAILGMIDASQTALHASIAGEYGVPGAKCVKLDIEVIEHQAVEQLFARPSVEHGLEQKHGPHAEQYKNIKITSVGRHDTGSNTTVTVTGALYPSPKDQRNEFLAWEVQQMETSVDRFEVTPETTKLMKRFQTRRGQSPLKKLSEIDRALAAHVTKIVGRPEMHAVMDLTFHSILAFKFGGQVVHRGWLESLVVGDTRTGKSEAAERLVRHFGAGEVVGGEAATLAGLVGGLQQLGGKDWAVTWGVIPINDRRIVVIDEISGLHPEDIGKMSDVRASGIAKLTKIQQEVTLARTRLLWLGNPRHGGMDQYTYGIDAIRPLIGAPEDIARFDLAMAVTTTDVAPEQYNKRIEGGELKYTADACHTMLMWCWTRGIEDVVWAKGAEDEVYKQALSFGARYVEDPPLVQAANARIKIARVAVALAARTFSTDASCERVVVTRDHVKDSVAFLDHLYDMPSFGYRERSRERLQDVADAEANIDAIRTYLNERKGLAKFLRNAGKFRRQDLEEILNIDRDSANAVINKLWEARMIRKEGADNRIEPTLHQLLREVW